MQSILDWEDRDIFFDTDDFAIEASLQIKHLPDTTENTELYPDNQVPINGIFKTPYAQRDFGAFIVDAEDPSFRCKWIDVFEYARAGDVLTIDGTEYYLESEPKSDGSGTCAMTLVPADTQDAIGDADTDQAQEGINPDATPKPTTGSYSEKGNLYRP